MKTTQLEEKLHYYHELLVQMLNEVEGAIFLAVEATRKRDGALANQIIAHDQAINTLRDNAEHDGIMLLVTERPYAHFLRQTISDLKIAGEIERMGDYASHLAKVGSSLPHSKEVDFIVSLICEMALSGAKMARSVADAMDSQTSDPVKLVAKMDDTIDAKRDMINKLLFDYQSTSDEERVALYKCFYLTKEMERLGDHATNICEWMVFTIDSIRPKLN
ncbi:phosphate signaling complex protein PhoU [uncultured Sphaerochaeta sp.]|uniref:phosphate signaling complex protein PhoU n=1 Tax=uncultured Sphaerochaeta sp. TaxID=886478 RepID=UPI002A0A2FD0|nr:phosphate signaling complex protein PhoU [uncultured Sphaerochaeta sp.]